MYASLGYYGNEEHEEEEVREITTTSNQKRRKRGLINIVGSALNVLFGDGFV